MSEASEVVHRYSIFHGYLLRSKILNSWSPRTLNPEPQESPEPRTQNTGYRIQQVELSSCDQNGEWVSPFITRTPKKSRKSKPIPDFQIEDCDKNPPSRPVTRDQGERSSSSVTPLSVSSTNFAVGGKIQFSPPESAKRTRRKQAQQLPLLNLRDICMMKCVSCLFEHLEARNRLAVDCLCPGILLPERHS